MESVDYKANDYHTARHPELISNTVLQFAWSECAKEFYFKDLPDRSAVFEFGGALGYNLLALLEQHECHMLEPSEIGRSHAQKHGITTYTEMSEIGDKKFDVVLCRHVLEHVDSPIDTLRAIKTTLKANAKLILVLPVEKNDQGPVSVEIDHHLFTWNPRTIINLVKKAGFKKVRYRYQFFNGRRLCLPIFRLFGSKAYVKAVGLTGKIIWSRELVVVCE